MWQGSDSMTWVGSWIVGGYTWVFLCVLEWITYVWEYGKVVSNQGASAYKM